MLVLRRPETILLLASILLCQVCSWAEDAGAAFEKANRLYEQGQYTEAIANYEALVQSGKYSAPLLFNLGNAYFKNGQLGRAIYNYRRAESLAPRDPDIQANLRFARDRISGSAPIQAPGWRRLLGYFSLNELAVTSAFALWLLIALLSAGRFRPALRPALRTYITVAGVFFWMSLCVLVVAYRAARVPSAIAVQDRLVVHLGPLTESQAAFTITDGTELRLENRREGWLQISDRSNRTGWVETNQVLVWPR
jgi:tetratricopeptide (TPR) repeat protein